MSGHIEELAALLHGKKLAFFGGAGVSTESGIPDFRSQDGLYSKQTELPPETLLSHSFFMAHTDQFYDYHRRNMLHTSAQPNPAHTVLAKWEQSRLLGVITQNIDNLHQKAGSTRVAELHGNVYRNYCMDCSKQYPLAKVLEEGLPLCDCGGLIRPDVVLYEESLPTVAWQLALEWLLQADVLLVGGTSLTVYPAAGLVRDFCKRGTLVIINQSPTPMDNQATLVVREQVGVTLAAVDAVLEERGGIM